jgi:hypothetical protein
MMNGRVQRQKHARPGAHARRRQALLVRAVVGSLVLCAVFGVPAADAQSAPESSATVAGCLAQFPPDSSIKIDRALDTKRLRKALAEIRRLAQAGELDLDSDLHIKALAEARNAPNETLWYSVEVNGQPGSDERWFKPLSELIVELRDSYALQSFTTSQHVKLELKLDRQNAVLSLEAAYPSEERAAQIANHYAGFFDRVRAADPDRDELVVLNNMTVSASGKQLNMRLEMSREQAGNLLRQQLSLP